MFILSAEKSKLSVLQKGTITSGAINVIDVKFQFDSDWDGMERIAVFRVGTEETSVVLDSNNCCKLPWECVRENDIGKTVYAGVCGMIDSQVVLPSVWVAMGTIKEGVSVGDISLPHTPSAAEQILASTIEARQAAEAAADRAEDAADKIEASIEEVKAIEEEVKKSTEVVENVAERIEDAVTKIEEANETLAKVEDAATKAENSAKESENAMVESALAAAHADEVASNIDDVAKRAEDAAVRSEEAAKRAEEAEGVDNSKFATDEDIANLLND